MQAQNKEGESYGESDWICRVMQAEMNRTAALARLALAG